VIFATILFSLEFMLLFDFYTILDIICSSTLTKALFILADQIGTNEKI
jgi:hypothetical protein